MDIKKPELPNDSVYLNPVDAVSEYNDCEEFDAKITYQMTEVDVEYAQDVIQKHFGIRLPYDYIIEMISRDSMIATEVYIRSLDDTMPRDLVGDYIAIEISGNYWPRGSGDHSEFFELLKKVSIERGWMKNE